MCTFGSRLRDRDPPERYVSREAYLNYLAQHPNDDARFFFPIAEGDWHDQEDCELVSQDARSIQLRERRQRKTYANYSNFSVRSFTAICGPGL